MKIKIKNTLQNRFSSGHPWVFSNELESSYKEIPAGSIVQLYNQKNEFLALGYYNPHSLICFRKISDNKEEIIDPEFFLNKLKMATHYRARIQYLGHSHRICFSEGDLLPGLIIDNYKFKSSQCLVVEILTAGMEKLFLPFLNEVLENLCDWQKAEGFSEFGYKDTTIVVHKKSAFRKMENLEILEPEVINPIGNLNEYLIRLNSKGKSIELHCDLLQGQKTGFFLDQSRNINLLISHINKRKPFLKKDLKILDLCSYVGQWSSHLAENLKEYEQLEITCVDSSQKALDLSELNLKNYKCKKRFLKLDVLEKDEKLLSETFDIVILDPPGLIKNRKEKFQGMKAYEKLNNIYMKLVRHNGLFVSCSCSGNLIESEFNDIILKSTQKAKVSFRQLEKGTQSPDHPILTNFSEGHYLKCFIAEKI